jgi:hypothetical protein
MMMGVMILSVTIFAGVYKKTDSNGANDCLYTLP